MGTPSHGSILQYKTKYSNMWGRASRCIVRECSWAARIKVDSGGRGLLVAGTLEDWKARVSWETRIGLRDLAQEKLRALGGFNASRVNAVSAKTEGVRVDRGRHGERIPRREVPWGARRAM